MEEKIKEEVNKKLETAEQNRERVIQERLEMLKKHVSNIVNYVQRCKAFKIMYLYNLELNEIVNYCRRRRLSNSS